MAIVCLWRAAFSNEAVNGLHAEAFGHRVLDDDWWGQVNRHSLGWVCAHSGSELVGFVNVAWDGGVHAFIVDTLVAVQYQRQGIAAQMLAICAREARKARCEWLHVDFEERLRPLYFGRAGFVPTDAGVMRLSRALGQRVR